MNVNIARSAVSVRAGPEWRLGEPLPGRFGEVSVSATDASGA